MTPLTRLSLKNRLVVGLVTLAVAVLGVISLTGLKQELMPSLQVPAAMVVVQADGFSPEELVAAVTAPTEQALESLPGLTSITSETGGSSVAIIVEWPFSADEGETMRAIRAAVDALRPSYPRGAEVDVVSGGADDLPAMLLSVGSDRAADEFVDALEQQLLPALGALPGVREVSVSGHERERVVVDLRPADVATLKVEPAAVAAALNAYGGSIPAGAIDAATDGAGSPAEADAADAADPGDAADAASALVGALPVTVGTAIGSIEEIAALPIVTADGVLRVSDFADVHLDSLPPQLISRVNGNPAITLQVMAAQGANVVDISHAVTAEVHSQQAALGAEFVTLFDQAPFIEQSIHDLAVEGALGLVFAVVVILAFLASWRSTVIAAVSIPLSLLITLIGLQLSSNTLNMLTLGALTIAIGRVVDDSIVVIENISRRRGAGDLTIEGVVASVRQVAGAITASTLTTVAVFLPIAFVQGIVGQLFRPFAVTVSIALFASLLVALTIVPVLAYWFMRRPRHPRRADVVTTSVEPARSDLHEIDTPPDRLQRAIMPVLGATRRHPVLTLASAAVVFVATLGMTFMLPTELLGSTGQETLELTHSPTPGATDRVAAAEPVEELLQHTDGVRDVVTTIPAADSAGQTDIFYDVQLHDGANADTVARAVTRSLDELTGAGEVRILTQDALVAGASGGGIALQIRGNDEAALTAASDLLETRLSDAVGVQSVSSSIAADHPLVRIGLDEARAARLGFDRASVAAAITHAVHGEPIGSLTLDGAERDVVLRTPGSEYTVANLGDLLLPVTPQQTAAAQRAASDRVQDDAEAAAERARLAANAELTDQISQAARDRAELASELADLTRQLDGVRGQPVTPYPPVDPETAGRLQAELDRAELLLQLEAAIAGARQAIAATDDQITALRESQSELAQQLVEQREAEAQAKAASETTGTAIALREIADITEERTAPSIARADGERQVVLTVTPKTGQLDAANRAVLRAIATAELPAGVTFQVGGVTAEQNEAFAQLGITMLAAIMLVILVMVATFRSFRGPFVLLVSIPFAATGAVLGLLLAGLPLGLPALIGLLMLIGIVVTNAIVLMDLINRLRAAGATLDEAVEHGTRLRLRPILMTAAATICALFPMALGLTGSGLFISRPLAVVVIGGLISSTLLTLLLVPVLYVLVERRRERRLAHRAARRERRIERRMARRMERQLDEPDELFE